MRKMTKDQFYDVLTIYISQIAKTVDVSDPDTIVFTEEFDDLLRHIKTRPNAKLKTVYLREDAETKMLSRIFKDFMNKSDSVRII